MARLDGRCEWNRGGLALRPNGNGGTVIEYVEACREPTAKNAEWCVIHKCSTDGCVLAAVQDGACVHHCPRRVTMNISGVSVRQ